MRLPHLSPNTQDMVLCFAAAATKHTGDANDRIARSGPLSLFAAFSTCMPGVLRGAAGCTKSGVTETAFNHTLENQVLDPFVPPADRAQSCRRRARSRGFGVREGSAQDVAPPAHANDVGYMWQAGFPRERDRRTVAIGKKKDPLQVLCPGLCGRSLRRGPDIWDRGADTQVGMYLLTKHRWLDISESYDMVKLTEGYRVGSLPRNCQDAHCFHPSWCTSNQLNER